MKKKLLAVALAMCVVIVCVVGFTLAYFTDAKQTTNVFTVGDVYIKLTEAAVMRDGVGNIVADPSKPRVEGSDSASVLKEHGTMYPGLEVCMDPTVEVTGSENAWIAAKVTISDGSGGLTQLIGYGDVGGHIDVRELLKGGFLAESAHVLQEYYVGDNEYIENVRYNENYAMVQVANPGEGKYVFYFFVIKPMSKGESVTFFEQLVIPEIWGTDDIQKLKKLEINFAAYAVQQVGFTRCFDAMTEAFPDQFDITVKTNATTP